MLHGEPEPEVSEKEKKVRQWMLYQGLSRKEAEIWWTELQETKAFQAKWERERSAKVDEMANRQRDVLAANDLRGEALDQAAAAYRCQLLDEGAEIYATALREHRAAQVKRRPNKGRVW
jgi:hypothetical protein